MADMIRCGTCKGQKKMSGIGGIQRDCWTCKGTGQVHKMPAPLEDVLKEGAPTAQPVHKVEMCSLEDIFPGVTQGVAAMAAHGVDEIVEALDNKHKKKEAEAVIEPKPIFDGYSDKLMLALLEEPKMPLIEWKKKHMHNNELFIVAKDARGNDVIAQELLDLHMRNSIRLMYAQSKPIAPRKVDTMAMQDSVAKHDPAYVRYEREQKAKAEAEARKVKV